MTVSLKHAFASAKSDGADTTLVQPSNWNAEHALTLSGPNKAVGRLASGSGSAEEVTIREVLTAARTYYVRTDGNDSNTGLLDSSGGAKLTVQGAMDAIAQIDFNGYAVTVQVRDGTYSGNIIVPQTVGQALVSDLTIVGNTTTPSNVVLSASSSAVISAGVGAKITLTAFKMTNSGGDCVNAQRGGLVALGDKLDYGATSGNHNSVDWGGQIFTSGVTDMTISGGAGRHLSAFNSGILSIYATTLTITGTPAFTTFLVADMASAVDLYYNTITGSATGARYSVVLNSVVNTYGAGATYLPGNSAGSTATGGQYA